MARKFLPLLLILLLCGCASSHLQLDKGHLIRPSYLILKDQGTILQALDRSFIITSGKALPTPFLSHCWGKDNQGKGTPEIPREAFFVGAPKSKLGLLGYELARRYPQALKAKAKPVVIQLAYLNQPLYGLLLLCPRHKEAFPGPSNYQISIPQSIALEAQRGEITVTFQVILGRKDQDQIYYSWILWLSKNPF